MLHSLFFRRVFFTILSVGFALLPLSQTASAANDADVEVLTRGPIHEAFADVSVDETPSGLVISAPVPDPINEIPPEYRPEGNRVEWIPGYWSWDEEQNNFIWVSGIWRDVPPGRQWIPGYWQSVEGGNQYISGYWTEIDQTPTVYLPPPPQPLQTGPSSPATAPNFVWIDGNWIWSNNGYAWQAGYWHEPRPDMVWIPAHYVWTPRGYIFVMGYWDYQPERRGVIFAPLHYPRPIYLHHGYFYRPHVMLNTDAVFLSLFIRRDRHNYYFGDYYDRRYEKRGFRPWHSEHATRYGYDPFYRSYRLHRMRDDRQWENNYHRQFEYRRDHRDARPPQRFEPRRERNFDQPHNRTSKSIGRLFGNAVEDRDQSKQFIRVNPDHEREFQSRSRKYHNSQTERRKFERAPNSQRQIRQPADAQKPERMKQSALPNRSRPEKTDYQTVPQKKSREADNLRGNLQEQTRNRFEAQQRKNQDRQPRIQTDDQSQALPQTRQRFKPQQPSANQPKVIPQENRRQRQQEQTVNQAQPQPQTRQRFKPQEPSANQPQVIPQENRRQRLQEQTVNQAQPQSQTRQRFKPQEPSANQPQVIPQENRRQRLQEQTVDQAQPQSQTRQRFKPQEPSANQPQVIPQENRRQRQQEQTVDQAQSRPKGKNRLQPQDQNEGEPQDVPQKERNPLRQILNENAGK